MRALSIKQPYAELIARGEKTREFRSRNLSRRGPFLVVASKQPDRSELSASGLDPAALVYGRAVCIVDMIDVEPTDEGYAYVLANPRRVEPEPITGSLAMYTVDDGRIRENGASAQILPPPSVPEARISSPRLPREPDATPFPPLDAADRTTAHARYWAEEQK